MADLVFKGVGKARAGREHVRGAGPSASRLGASPSFFDLYRCDVFVLLDVSAGLRLGLERDDVEDVTLVRLVRAPAVRAAKVSSVGSPSLGRSSRTTSASPAQRHWTSLGHQESLRTSTKRREKPACSMSVPRRRPRSRPLLLSFAASFASAAQARRRKPLR